MIQIFHCLSLKFVGYLISMKVSRRDVEVGVGNVAYNPGFAKIVTYLTWIYTHKFVILSAKPQEVPKLLSLLYPLPPVVWLCFAGTMIFLAVVKYIFFAIKNSPNQKINNEHMLRRDSRRILIAMSLFNVWMFYLFYINSFESQLVVKEFEEPIDTIQDLLDSGLQTYYPGKTAIAKFLISYPTKQMKQIMTSKGTQFPFAGKIPSYVEDRFVRI